MTGAPDTTGRPKRLTPWTRGCFLDSLRSKPIDLDGFELRYGDGDNIGSETVFLTRIGSDGEYHLVRTLSGGVLPRR